MAGVGLRAVQEALGHKSIAMPVRDWHLSPDFHFRWNPRGRDLLLAFRDLETVPRPIVESALHHTVRPR